MMVEYNQTKIKETDRDYLEDIKIQVPYELKMYILADMLKLYIDNELKEGLHLRDGIFKLKDVSVEFKYGTRWDGGKLPLEIYHDIDSKFPGNLSKANADTMIIIKKYKDNPMDLDIFIMDYKKLVEWWWTKENYKTYEPYQIKNKPSYNKEKNIRWRSSFYPFIVNRFPQGIITAQKKFFNTSFLYKKNDLNYFMRGY